MPSWKFFHEIAPSPRIEYAALSSEKEKPQWQELRLRPETCKFWDYLISIFYNPNWNQALYLNNCAEQLIINPNEHALQDIFDGILEHAQINSDFLQFRLVFIHRKDDELSKEVLFISEVEELE